jgi:hypothetical protein
MTYMVRGSWLSDRGLLIFLAPNLAALAEDARVKKVIYNAKPVLSFRYDAGHSGNSGLQWRYYGNI